MNLYQLRADLQGPKCPDGLDVPESECLKAALQVGAQYNPQSQLNVDDWDHTPCGCFLWGAQYSVRFDRGRLDDCKENSAAIGMVCRDVSRTTCHYLLVQCIVVFRDNLLTIAFILTACSLSSISYQLEL